MKSTRSKKYIRRRKRRRRIKKAFELCILTVIVVIGVKAALNAASDYMNDEDETESYEVSAPEKREIATVYEQLLDLSQQNAKYEAIYDKKDEYPDELLSSLINNPEMLNFVYGYLDADTTTHEGFDSSDLEGEYPLFIQWDTKWGYCSYGESNIAMSGCGPTCLSMVLYALTGNCENTPYEVCEFSEQNEYYIEGTGTSWSLMTQGASQYGITATELSLSEATMKAELDAGHPIICAVGPGDFTTSGHFIMIYGYDSEGFKVNDPNCIARSQEAWSYDTISSQIKNLWSYQM